MQIGFAACVFRAIFQSFVLVHAYFFTSYLYFDCCGGPNISVGNKFFILLLKNKFGGGGSIFIKKFVLGEQIFGGTNQDDEVSKNSDVYKAVAYSLAWDVWPCETTWWHNQTSKTHTSGFHPRIVAMLPPANKTKENGQMSSQAWRCCNCGQQKLCARLSKIGMNKQETDPRTFCTSRILDYY